MYPDNNPKTALGLTKPQMSLTPSTALVHLALAFADGAAKYGPYNWREKKVSSMIYIDAIERHLACWVDGENVAPDSGVHHLAHVMACCAIIIDAETVGTLNDNRPPKAPTAELIRAMTKGGLVSQADLDLLEERLKKKCQQVETARLTPAGPAVYGTTECPVIRTETIAMPFGAFEVPSGIWHHNPYLTKSREEQRAYMVATGKICDTCGRATAQCGCQPQALETIEGPL